MPLRSYEPSYPLNRYIMEIWDYQNLFDDEDATLTILPDTAVYLCFLYADKLQTTHKDRIYTTQSGLAGFQTFRSDLGGVGKISGVSARLTPWGLSVFRRGIARDCAEARVDCRDIFPRYEVEALEERLATAADSKTRVRHVETYLMSVLSEADEDHLVTSACTYLRRSEGSLSIRSLAHRLDTTERTLERRFLAQTGTHRKSIIALSASETHFCTGRRDRPGPTLHR